MFNLVDDEFLSNLAMQVTSGLKADFGVIPRQFLRELITILDLVDEHEDYIPKAIYKFPTSQLSSDEQSIIDGPSDDAEDNDSGYQVEELEW